MAAVLAAAPAAGQAPISAIDWLSESITAPADPVTLPETAPVDGVRLDTIAVTSLDAVSLDGVGLLPISVTGLPRDLWAGTSGRDLAVLLARTDAGHVPAMQELLFTLLLAELDPPLDADPRNLLFLSRVDTLLALGAVEQAQALLERAGARDAETFRRWFDTSLLTGTEDSACAELRQRPDLSPTLPARIFCLARGGDWNAAALTLETGRALGEMTGEEDALLARFLDVDLFEGAPPLPPPTHPTPLILRLREAIGEPLPAAGMPLAFAHVDLRDTAGWKAQLDAAERLARTGAIDGNRLLALYTDRAPAASGGVWARVSAVQALDNALAAGKAEAVASALPRAWSAMEDAALVPVLARLYAERLLAVPLTAKAGEIAFRAALLTPGYEAAASARNPAGAEEHFLKAIAQGNLSEAVPYGEMGRAVAEGFLAPQPPETLARLVDEGQLGAAILRAIELMAEGASGDPARLTDAVAFFRSVGFEDVARRAALQVLILDLRG